MTIALGRTTSNARSLAGSTYTLATKNFKLNRNTKSSIRRFFLTVSTHHICLSWALSHGRLIESPARKNGFATHSSEAGGVCPREAAVPTSRRCSSANSAPDVFRHRALCPANGVGCDVAKKLCMAERRGSDVERRDTKHLFGQ
jgi:hypothetical protein